MEKPEAPELSSSSPVSMVSISPRGLLGPQRLSLFGGAASARYVHTEPSLPICVAKLAESWKGRDRKVYLCVLPYPSIPDSITDSTFLILLKSYILCKTLAAENKSLSLFFNRSTEFPISKTFVSVCLKF